MSSASRLPRCDNIVISTLISLCVDVMGSLSRTLVETYKDHPHGPIFQIEIHYQHALAFLYAGKINSDNFYSALNKVIQSEAKEPEALSIEMNFIDVLSNGGHSIPPKS